ncbi:hypothetical protein BgiMline_001221, partial [Biomphalaria glabrata]
MFPLLLFWKSFWWTIWAVIWRVGHVVTSCTSKVHTRARQEASSCQYEVVKFL